MTAGAIYYTSNRLEERLFLACQQQILKGFQGEIVSVSLKPLSFGKNIVLPLEPSYTSMVKQIITGLEVSTADYVFFLEHDVLYSKEHFDFVPAEKNVYYYNTNVFRWDYPTERMVRWDNMLTLSQLCVDRLFALDHYQKRLQAIKAAGYDKDQSREPDWARKWGYEPGTKKKKNGAFLEEKSDRWSSRFPNIDIRHKGTFSPPKVTLESFKHQPTGWTEKPLSKIHGWNTQYLRSLAGF